MPSSRFAASPLPGAIVAKHVFIACEAIPVDYGVINAALCVSLSLSLSSIPDCYELRDVGNLFYFL